MKERLSEPAAKLRRFAAVAFEKSTKSLFASNFGERDCRRLIHLRFGLSLSGFRLADQFVVQALVRSFFVVVDFELLAQDIHVLVSKDDEMIETFLLDRLDEPFGEGDHVRRTDRRPLCLNLSLFQGRNERLRVLPVIIQHQNLAFRAFRLDRLNELCRLPNHPLFIRLVGRRRNIDSTSFDVDEDQNKDIAKPRFRDDLGFEKADVPSQFFVRRLGQNEQKSGVDVTEVGHREKCSRSRKTLGGRNFCTPLEGPRLVTRKSKSTERARTNAHG